MFKKLFKSSNERYIRKLNKIVDAINALESDFEKLSDDDLRAKTAEFKNRIVAGETLDDLLPEAFAVVREGAKRTLGQRHFDVQLMGGIVLHRGQIAEMKTGEGKTLVSTLAVYLNALSGKGVHVVTVNDYLAKRDSEWMGQIYRFLGLSVDCVVHDMKPEDRKAAYLADITYGTNNEFGFDYLRDNMSFRQEDMVQRPFSYAIVDEVDSILIDEARTPLIISGPAQDSSERYKAVDKIMWNLKPEHYEKDEKHRQVNLTEAGNDAVEDWLRDAGIMTEGTLYDLSNVALVHHVEQALRAHTLFTKDVDYIVRDGQVMIVDEFTGRIMAGRRYSDGLHQALEAKENVQIQAESQTLASITYQNYFRLYPKLAGMTGTAMTESGEFDSTYNLTVVEIPTNNPIQRQDEQDMIYATEMEKFKAIVAEIEKAHAKQQPVLVGTTSVEKSELLASLLQKQTNLRFEVLNAKNHEREALIVAQAGAPGAITIATNMAGRGTDIQLGGNLAMRLQDALAGIEDEQEKQSITRRIEDEIKEGQKIVREAGGLCVIGTERHENRRIDNQLRGRSGRQGDPGRSIFFLSLEDDLMRIFGADRLKSFVQRSLKPGEAIHNAFITKAIAKAQHKVEEFYFDQRKNVLKYDDVMNEQRKVIYERRKEIMALDSVSELVKDIRYEMIDVLIDQMLPNYVRAEDWDLKSLRQELIKLTAIDIPVDEWIGKDNLSPSEVAEKIKKLTDDLAYKKNQGVDPKLVQMVEKNILIQCLDQVWKEHLQAIDFLKRSIGLRAYGQRDPLNEYKKEAFSLFAAMLDRIRQQTTIYLAHAQITVAPVEKKEETLPNGEKVDFSNVGRNELCPCGSGKKFKHCHGKI